MLTWSTKQPSSSSRPNGGNTGAEAMMNHIGTSEAIYVSGSFRGTLQLDGFAATAASQADLFVAKLGP